MPNSTTVMPDSTSVILDSASVMPDSATVIPDSIRDPVVRPYWIADQVRNDKGVRNDSGIRNDNGIRNDSAASVLMGRPGEKSGGARLSVAV